MELEGQFGEAATYMAGSASDMDEGTDVNFVYVERVFRDCVSYHRAARHLLFGPTTNRLQRSFAA